MTRQAPVPPELALFTDGSWVILGAHLSLEEARARFGEEFARENGGDEPAVIDHVDHCWVRQGFVGEDDLDALDDGIEIGTRWWILHETTVRPTGVVRRATVVW
jgi:hypothetical protein